MEAHLTMPTRPITINLPVKLFNRIADLSSALQTPRETLVRVWVESAAKRAEEALRFKASDFHAEPEDTIQAWQVPMRGHYEDEN